MGASCLAGLDESCKLVAKRYLHVCKSGSRFALGGNLTPNRSQAGIALVFRNGTRPSASDIDSALAQCAQEFGPVHVTHRGAPSEGWVELLASGLTFDLSGLSPGPALPAPQVGHSFGLDSPAGDGTEQALILSPGPHLEGAGGMLPVVRIACGLAALLARALPVSAVCWIPAGTAMAPDYFSRIVTRWLGGGAFPALGLTALSARKDGAMESVGMAFFTGVELTLEGRKDESAVETAKLAARIIDLFVTEGVGEESLAKGIEGGEGLHAQMSSDGHRIIVRRRR